MIVPPGMLPSLALRTGRELLEHRVELLPEFMSEVTKGYAALSTGASRKFPSQAFSLRLGRTRRMVFN